MRVAVLGIHEGRTVHFDELPDYSRTGKPLNFGPNIFAKENDPTKGCLIGETSQESS